MFIKKKVHYDKIKLSVYYRNVATERKKEKELNKTLEIDLSKRGRVRGRGLALHGAGFTQIRKEGPPNSKSQQEKRSFTTARTENPTR